MPSDFAVPAAPLGNEFRTEPASATTQATAKKAKALLCAQPAFRDPSATERSTIAAAFAAKGYVVYGKAFDLVEMSGDESLSLSDLEAVKHAIDDGRITLVEVKSTSANRDEHFRGHFFSMSTAELLVAQSLGRLFKFAFVNTTTSKYIGS